MGDGKHTAKGYLVIEARRSGWDNSILGIQIVKSLRNPPAEIKPNQIVVQIEANVKDTAFMPVLIADVES